MVLLNGELISDSNVMAPRHEDASLNTPLHSFERQPNGRGRKKAWFENVDMTHS